MPQRDGKSQIQMAELGTITVSGTNPVVSEWLDTKDFDSATLVGATNVVTDAGTASGITAVLQHSNSTATASAEDVPADEIVGDLADLSILADSEDNQLQGMVGYVGNRRYVRLRYTGTPGADAELNPLGILGLPANGPVADIGAGVQST